MCFSVFLRNCFLLQLFYCLHNIYCAAVVSLRTWYVIIHLLVFTHEIMLLSIRSEYSTSLLVANSIDLLIKYFRWIISVTFCALRCRHETATGKRKIQFFLFYSKIFIFFHVIYHPSIHPSILIAHFQFDIWKLKTQNNRIFECMQAFCCCILIIFISSFISFTLQRLVIL